MSMMYDPLNPNGPPRPGTPQALGGAPPMQPQSPGNAPGGANAAQGFLGGLKNAAMGGLGAAQQAVMGTPSVQMQPGQDLGQMPQGMPGAGQQLTGPPQLSQGPNQGGLLQGLGSSLMNNRAVAPVMKFGKQLASYF